MGNSYLPHAKIAWFFFLQFHLFFAFQIKILKEEKHDALTTEHWHKIVICTIKGNKKAAFQGITLQFLLGFDPWFVARINFQRRRDAGAFGLYTVTLMSFYGFVNRFCYDCDLVISLETFWLRTTGLHQGTVSIYWVRLFEPPWLLVIGWWVRFKALLSLLEEKTIPSAFFCRNDRLLYC